MSENKRKLNCWELMGCGRGPGGRKEAEFGICPAATEEKLDGVHGGKNGGRACWAVAGTLCLGEPDGTFAKKYRVCSLCDFYIQVRNEEHGDLTPTYILLDIVRNIPA